MILGTSDMHGNVWGWSYEDGQETSNNGMARLSAYIAEVRGENLPVFLIDAGDDIQGIIMTDDIANKEPDQPHPVIAAMNAMEYDAMTLGNHEFNWGVPVLQQVISTAKFPVLSQNILDADGRLLTGVDLCVTDPRRDELISYINEGLLPVPYNRSYNLADYASLAAQAEEARAASGPAQNAE